MNVHSAEYIISAMKPEQYPRNGHSEIAFVGRSNVGKSSLMNCILNRKNLAKTSSRPGKTQTINYFEINKAFYVVDLPGYGFAKVPLAVKENWGRVMTSYLAHREPLKMAAVLVDARHKPSEQDMEMLALLDDAEVPTLVVATKVDKLKRSERSRNMKRIRETLELDRDAEILSFSSETGEGKKELWEIISDFL